MCGGNDLSVSERLLVQWGEMTAGAFQHHIFDRGGHYYWLDNSRGEESGSVGESSTRSALKSHESEFLRLLIRYSNPFHILMSESDGVASDDEDQKSTVSSVTFQQDTYRSVDIHSARQTENFDILSARQADEKMSSSRASSRGGNK